jgi:hypothetical protein
MKISNAQKEKYNVKMVLVLIMKMNALILMDVIKIDHLNALMVLA